MKKSLYKVMAIILGIISVFMANYGRHNKVSAAEIADMDKTAIENDLGEIDVLLYPKNPLGKPRVIQVQEYCYSTRPLLAEYYGFYIYVYNPTEQAIDVTSADNVVSMAVAYGIDGTPSSYENKHLEYLDSMENKRFYKFKLSGSADLLKFEQGYASNHDGKRRYDIAGIQLRFEGGTQAKDSTVAKTYEWTGYAHGCGPDYNAASTLECNEETLETLSLKVTPTQFRPAGTNGKNGYTQDSLHSVWFSVPNRMIEDNGELWGVHAEWYDAVLAPVLVTGHKASYDEVNNNLGKVYASSADYLSYAYCTDYLPEYDAPANCDWTYGFSYAQYLNNDCFYTSSIPSRPCFIGKIIPCVSMCFYSGSGTDSADTYTVSSSLIEQRMLSFTNNYVGEYSSEKFLNRYNKLLFSSITEEKTVERLI